ncbi:MAG: tail fiber domain-containing protein [bacterium]
MGGGGGKPKTPEYASTTSENPYATGTASKSGSSYKLNPFLAQQNQFVEQNIPSLYNQLLNPNLDNPVTKARSDAFYRQFNEDSNKTFENNLIDPLSKRNLLRSSALTDLSKSFSQDQNKQVANFNDQLISNNTADTSSLINTLLNQYLMGANLGNQAISNAKGDAQQVNGFNQSNYSTAMSGYSAEQAVKAAQWKAIGDTAAEVGGAAIKASDIRAKENIVKIGEKNGFNLYQFDYKNGFGLPKGRQTGVMAQEVEKINPDAVIEINGIKHVNYSMIGV